MEQDIKIKICGLRNLADAALVSEFPITYAGFIFAKESKRQVTVKQAKQMRQNLLAGIQAVGVFINTAPDRINEIALEVGLDIAQLHGQETDAMCSKIKIPVWKMISGMNLDAMKQAAKYPHAAGILFDAASQYAFGGTGKTFPWENMKGAREKYFTILAGGLSPENICDAAKAVRPQALDVNSGVETDGRKDRKKLEALFAAMSILR